MLNQTHGKPDLESGARPLHPMMLESPEMRWSFIRKVYFIIAIQLLATIAVAAVVVTVRPIPTFFATTTAGFALSIILMIVPFIRKLILEAVILTAVVVVGLTLFTFWVARRGQDFSFLCPFLFGSLLVLIVFGLIQVFFPLGKLSVMIYGCLGAILFCGYIVYDTDNLIKRFSYDQYIWSSVTLYLDVINLFSSLLTAFSAAD